MTSVSERVANRWPLRLELGPQLEVVEDLPVEDDPQRAVFVGHGLLAGGEVDDRQPRVTEGRLPVAEDAEFVRPPIADGADHPLHLLERGRREALIQVDDSRNAAHQWPTSDTGSTSSG